MEQTWDIGTRSVQIWMYQLHNFLHMYAMTKCYTLHPAFTLTQDLKENTIHFSSYSPLNEGHASTNKLNAPKIETSV